MVNEHNQDSDVSPLLQRGLGRRSGCIRSWVSVVAPERRCCGAIPGSAFGGYSYSHQDKNKKP